PPLPVGLRLLLHTLALRIGDPPRFGEDLLRVRARTCDQGAVLVEQLARLVTRPVGLLDGLPDAFAALVDQLLNRPEGVAPEDEEGDTERDQRPDDQRRTGLAEAG